MQVTEFLSRSGHGFSFWIVSLSDSNINTDFLELSNGFSHKATFLYQRWIEYIHIYSKFLYMTAKKHCALNFNSVCIIINIFRLIIIVLSEGPPLWSSDQNSWWQIHRSRVRFPLLPDFLSCRGSGTGSTWPTVQLGSYLEKIVVGPV
jgi:hypothetical protein